MLYQVHVLTREHQCSTALILVAYCSPHTRDSRGFTSSLPDSWIDVPQGKGEGERGEGERGEGEEEEGGALMHSRSQHEMEQLLASAASDDEAEEGDTA